METEANRLENLIKLLPEASILTRKISKFMAENEATVAQIVVAIGLFVKEIAEEIGRDTDDILEAIVFAINHTEMSELQ